MTAADFIDDIPADIAARAHAGTSFDPEKRGEQERAGYAETLAADFAALLALADTDEKREQLAEQFARYRAAYRERTIAYLQAHGRCLSTMITGRSNFPVRRSEKASDSTDRRREELIAFRDRALAAIRKVLRPEDAPIMLGDDNAAERIDSKLAVLEALQERMKAANAAIRAHAAEGPEAQAVALVALGYSEINARKLMIPDFAGRVGFPGYALTNNAANIRRLKGRAVAVERAAATPATETEGANARIEDAPAENRVRLFFPGKPEVSVRTALKARGFRWAPSAGAWSAHRNPGSLALAREIAGADLPTAA